MLTLGPQNSLFPQDPIMSFSPLHVWPLNSRFHSHFILFFTLISNPISLIAFPADDVTDQGLLNSMYVICNLFFFLHANEFPFDIKKLFDFLFSPQNLITGCFLHFGRFLQMKVL